ncbi:translocation/assembly module TamB domain-containing protein [Vibrio sp. SCSIO 43136]|uniref:autotransporter assembly complex protein TamB n=1 Tax=Vibrio sp. SCSIO 43136 TaxID=2819101 RepID=UPI00207636A4|nr:translocation/assembly module TamB domain-containing protein [Vibrio sp. SCSIO 43136]USD64980.1 translocation/assembly module TamB [Vibrio sp. SCSIO 43136]
MSRRWAKWFVRFAIAVPSTILLILLLIGGLVLTNPGLKVITWAGQKALPQLSIGKADGALLTGMSLHQVSFQDPDLFIELDAQQVVLNLNLQCLMTPEICIDELALVGLDFALTDVAPSETPAVESEPVTEVVLPIPVTVKNIKFNDIALNILGTQVNWQQFESGIVMSGREVTLSPTTWRKIRLALPASEAPEAEQEPAPATAIELPEVLIPVDARIEQLDIHDFVLEGESPVVVNYAGLKGFAADHYVEIDKLAVDIPELDAQLHGQITLNHGYPLDASLSAKLKQTDLAGQTLALDATGSVENLGLDASLGGVVEALLKGELSPLDPKLPFDASLSKVKLQWPLTGDADYHAKVGRFNAKGSLDGYQIDGDLAAQGKDIPNLDLRLAGKGDLGQIDLKLVKLETLGGKVLGELYAGWKEQVNWRANLQLEEIQPGLQWPQAEGSISGSLTTDGHLTENGGWFVNLPLVALQGELRNYPLKLQGDIQAQDPTGSGEIELVTDSLSLAHGPNTVFVSGHLDKEWQLDVSLHLPEFAKSLPELQGQAEGEIAIRGEFKQPKVRVNLGVDELKYQQLAQVESLKLNGEIQPLPVPTGNIDLVVNQSLIEGQAIDLVALSFSGNEDQHSLDLNVLSDIVSTHLLLSGSLEQEPLKWQGALEVAKVKTEQGVWTLDRATGLGFDGVTNRLALKAHCWTQANASLCLEQDVEVGESGEVQYALNQFDFSQIAMFVPKATELSGEVNANVWAKWAPDQPPQVKAHVDLPKGQVVQKLDTPLTLGWNEIGLSAELKDDVLSTGWNIDIVDNGVVSGQASIANVQSEQHSIDAALDIKQIHLGMLKPLIGEFSQADANIDSSLKLSGPVAHPKVFGQLVVNQMVVNGDVTPIDVQEGELVVRFDGYQGDVTANIQTPDGVLKLDGSGNWAQLDAWQTKLRIFADELSVNLPPMVQMKVIPDMTISANPEVAKIDGQISLPWARIEVEELPESAIGVSSDEVLLDDNYQVIQNEKELPWNIETNIRVLLGDDFKLTAFGLEGLLNGQLQVSQKDKGPYVVGEVNIKDGTYRSFGQDLVINKGKILMNGPVDLPYVSIEAIRNPDNTRDDVTAGIRVDGPATEPTVTIFSDPSLPQANALSYLLRGQDIDAETGGNMMTTTLIGLSLAKSGRVVGEIGQAFGVQDLQLDTAGSGDDSQVTVSGYILPGLQVKYGVGIFNSLGEFTVRYRLMQDLYLEAVSGTTSAVDLLYQFEFD